MTCGTNSTRQWTTASIYCLTLGVTCTRIYLTWRLNMNKSMVKMRFETRNQIRRSCVEIKIWQSRTTRSFTSCLCASLSWSSCFVRSSKSLPMTLWDGRHTQSRSRKSSKMSTTSLTRETEKMLCSFVSRFPWMRWNCKWSNACSMSTWSRLTRRSLVSWLRWSKELPILERGRLS